MFAQTGEAASLPIHPKCHYVFGLISAQKNFRYDERIVVKVYANLRGLGHTYVNQGILGRLEDLADFVTGFNKVNEGTDFIDAGNAKEGADRKLRGKIPFHPFMSPATLN